MALKPKLTPVAAFLLLVLAVGTTVLAQSSASFDLGWHVIGGGGGESSSASYQVNGTIGQNVTGPPSVGSVSFVLSSGYWFIDTRTTIYLPAVLRS